MAYTGASEEYFYANLYKSHTPTVRAEVWYDGEIVIPDLKISGGSISLKADDLSRSSLSGLTTFDTDLSLLPDTIHSDLSIYGHEIRIYRGIEYTNGLGTSEIEEVPVGIFRVQSHTAREFWNNDNPEGQNNPKLWYYGGAEVSIDGEDRTANIIDYKMITITQPTPGNTIEEELDYLCQDGAIIEIDKSNFGLGLGDGTGAFLGTETVIPAYSSIVYQEDRGKAITDIAGFINCRAFVSREGKLRLETIEALPSILPDDPQTLPPIFSVSTKNTRDGLYNAVVARGERIADIYPVQGVYENLDYSTKTYWGGPFGNVPFFYESDLLGDTVAAELAAEFRLESILKDRTRTFTITTIPDPTLDPNDIVSLELPGRNPFPAKITSITLPLGLTDTMTIELVATETAVADALVAGVFPTYSGPPSPPPVEGGPS